MLSNVLSESNQSLNGTCNSTMNSSSFKKVGKKLSRLVISLYSVCVDSGATAEKRFHWWVSSSFRVQQCSAVSKVFIWPLWSAIVIGLPLHQQRNWGQWTSDFHTFRLADATHSHMMQQANFCTLLRIYLTCYEATWRSQVFLIFWTLNNIAKTFKLWNSGYLCQDL